MNDLNLIVDYLVGLAGVQVLLLFMFAVIAVAIFAIHLEVKKIARSND